MSLAPRRTLSGSKSINAAWSGGLFWQFAVGGSSGRLTALGQVETEAVPSAFSLDPEGHFLFAAGSASNRLAAYRVNSDTGALTPLGTYDVGKRPMWVLITRLGG